MRLKASLFLFISNFFFAVINIITFYFATQNFIPKNFGYIAVANSFLAFFNFFSDLGLMKTHIKKMAEKQYSQNEYFSINLILKACLLLLNSIIFYIILIYQFPQAETEDIQLYVLNLLFFVTAIQSFNLIYKATFQAQMNFVKMQVSFSIEKITNGVLQFIAILILHNFEVYVISSLISSIVGVLISFYLTRNFKLVKINKNQITDYLKFSFIVSIPTIFTLFINNYGIFIFLRYFDESLLGVFFIINNTLAVIYIFEESISMILLPDFSSLKMKNNFNEIKEVLRIYEKYVLIIWNFLMIGGLIFSFFIIDMLYGIYYANNGTIYLLLAVFFLFNWALLNPYIKFLMATNKLKIVVLISFIDLFFTIICWFLLIPIYNIVALRLGTLLSSFIIILIIRVYIRKHYSFKFFDRESFLLIIFGFLFVMCYFLFFNIFDTNLIFLMLKFFISIIIFTSYIFLLKIITIKEIKDIYKQIKPKSMINYFRTQI